MSNVIDFPRKIEWKPVEAWMGTVPNTQLSAKVERPAGGDVYTWFAWNGHMVVAAGTADSLEAGKEATRRALEKSSLIVRLSPLTRK